MRTPTTSGDRRLLDKLAQYSPHPDQAHQAADDLRRQFAALKQQYAANSPRRVLLQFGTQPLFTSSGATLQSQVLALCGGRTFADSRTPWPQISREQVLARQPQAIVITGGAKEAANVKAFWRPQLQVPVIALNEGWFNRGGPRLLLARSSCAASWRRSADAGVLVGYSRHGGARRLRRTVSRQAAHGSVRRTGIGRGHRGRRRHHPRYGAGQRPGVLGQGSHRSGGGDDHLRLDAAAGAPAAPPAEWVLPVLDAVGLAVFVGIGVNRLRGRHRPAGGDLHGVITGVGGGIIRDVLAREIPMILRTEIYATACIIGGIVHATAFYTFHMPLQQAMMLA